VVDSQFSITGKPSSIALTTANPGEARMLPSHRVSVDRLPPVLRAELNVAANAKTLFDVLADISDEDLLDDVL